MKKLFKFLKIIAIVLVALLIVLIVTPFFFKKPIENLVKTEINKTLKAKVDFTDFKLSFLHSFPNVYIALEGLTVAGVDTFAKDTLITFKTFSVNVDLVSAIQMKNIKVKSVFLDGARITAHKLSNGKVNWDIMKADTSVKTKKDTAQSKPLDFGANLQKLEIAHAYIKYVDDSSHMSSEIKDLNFLLSGDFTAKTTDMKIKTSIESLDFVMGGMKYLKQAKISYIAELSTDLEHGVYTFKDNEFKLNDIALSMSGVVKMPKKAIDIDLKFKTNKTEFKSILSLVPALYMKDFKGLQTSGSLKLDGYVKGVYEGKRMPNVGLNFSVINAMFKYPTLPKSVNNVNVDMKVFFDGVNNDNTTMDVNKFHVELAGNPFDVGLHIKTPISDMGITGSFVGKLDFGSIADVVPMDSLTLKGLLESNVDIMGKMSAIKQNKYEDFKADGTIKLQNFVFVSPLFRQGVKISSANMTFSPKFVDLSSFNMIIGKSDIQMTGKLEKFIPYVFSKDTICGTLNVTSTLLDVNELMGPPAKTVATTKKDTTQLSVVPIPANINFVLSTKMKQINYDKLVIKDLVGGIVVRKSKAVLKNLGMNMLEGSVVMNGEYNTQNVAKPSFDFSFAMKDIDIPSAYAAFNTVEKLAPGAKNCKGRISADLTLASLMDQHMMPVYASMNGKGRLSSKSVEVSNSAMFNKIADALKNDKYRQITFANLNISFEIKDGRIYIKPFDTKIGNSKMNISGDQGIDQTINYLIKASIPRAELGGAANSVLNGLTAAAASKGLAVKLSETIDLNIGVVGTVAKPEVKLLMGDQSGKSTESVKAQVQEKVQQKVAEVKQDVTQKAKEQADKLVKDAEAEAQKIRAAAKALAQTTRTESSAAADKIVKEATNPFAKVAAQKAADKVRKDGESKATGIENEGNAKADALVNKAKADAAKIK
jgi:hypothetical protein